MTKATPSRGARRRSKQMLDEVEDHEKRLVAEMQEASALLALFGLRLHGFDPGITAYFEPTPDTSRLDSGLAGGLMMGISGRGYWGEPIAFSRIEWRWLKPLLEELRDRRKTNP